MLAKHYHVFPTLSASRLLSLQLVPEKKVIMVRLACMPRGGSGPTPHTMRGPHARSHAHTHTHPPSRNKERKRAVAAAAADATAAGFEIVP
ncbi:hypothetical protein BS50DRAFT_570551 [Corynespora cassiicola Philippines]|uniref:Uncharacterized protein n=1 Tax=Corynespora cassiicola Philippines TaxID=1448308 RepID=A0A2T2P0E6_CORCC|nr:hypothetical protein BS50DRAFT_570551 [Corynespora cassiicola Philippines]